MNDLSVHWLLQLPLTSINDVRTALMAVLLVTAAVIDYRTLRIPNWLTLGGLVGGLASSTLAAQPWWIPLLLALGGAAAGLLSLLPLYAFSVMGAGDVKLMAMVGAWLGLTQVVPALLCVLVTGGLAALAFAVAHRSVPRLAANLRSIVHGAVLSAFSGQPFRGMAPGASLGTLPYGVSISAGTLVYVVAHQLGYL